MSKSTIPSTVEPTPSAPRALRVVEGAMEARATVLLRRPLTEPELPELVRIAARVGVNEVYLQRLVTSDRGLARQDLTLYNKDEAAQVAAEGQKFIEEAERLGRELGVELLGSGSVTASDSVRRVHKNAPWRACWRPWKLIYITAQGNVLPCCIAPFTETPYEDLILGNIFERSVSDVWNGPEYRSWRRRMMDGTPPQPCAGCGVDWSL